MGLGIYTTASDPESALSQDGDFSNPLLMSIDGRAGGAVERLLYIRNDDSAYYYTDIELSPSATGLIPVDSGSWKWKLSAGSTQPTERQWLLISTGNTITLDDLGDGEAADTSTYLPFWLRIEIPANSTAVTYSNISLQIVAEQIRIFTEVTNEAPVAEDQEIELDEDTESSLIVLVATDADDDELTYSIVDSPEHGDLSGSGNEWTYTPDEDFNGDDSFTFKAFDGHLYSNVATVSITVNPVEEPIVIPGSPLFAAIAELETDYSDGDPATAITDQIVANNATGLSANCALWQDDAVEGYAAYEGRAHSFDPTQRNKADLDYSDTDTYTKAMIGLVITRRNTPSEHESGIFAWQRAANPLDDSPWILVSAYIFSPGSLPPGQMQFYIEDGYRLDSGNGLPHAIDETAYYVLLGESGTTWKVRKNGVQYDTGVLWGAGSHRANAKAIHLFSGYPASNLGDQLSAVLIYPDHDSLVDLETLLARLAGM